MVAGVYLIVNKKTGQKYAGGSIDIEKRIYDHINAPNNGSYIDNAIQKYGFDDFDWQVIEELPADWEIIGKREKYWINFYNTFKNPSHYNLTEGGEGISGWIHSEKTKKKMSENSARYWEGKNLSEEHKKKISESLTGITRSEETRKKMNGENHHLSGKKHSPETLKKMSETHSQKRNITGYYRVSKRISTSCKQGFTYRYGYYDINGKKHVISSVSLEKLEKRVKNAGLPWKILDEEMARKTLNEVSS